MSDKAFEAVDCLDRLSSALLLEWFFLGDFG
jgi:hypothetical protein